MQADDAQLLLVTDVAPSLWQYAGATHVYGARQLARTTLGCAALVEPCLDKLATWLLERKLHPGECVTIALSLVRGLGELGAQNHDAQGTWWLTAQLCPVFVPGTGSAAHDGAREVLAAVGQATSDRACERLMAGMHAALADPLAAYTRFEAFEQQLLELAAPRGLAQPQPDRASFDEILQLPTVVAPQMRRRDRRAAAHPRRSRQPSSWYGASFDAARTLLVATIRRRKPRPQLAAGFAAALVVVLGIVWPQDRPVASAESVVFVTPEPVQPTEDVSGVNAHPMPVVVAADVDPVFATAELIGYAPENLEVVETFGDVVVLRVLGDRAAGEIVVLERANENWLVRDVYSVANQPVDVETG